LGRSLKDFPRLDTGQSTSSIGTFYKTGHNL